MDDEKSKKIDAILQLGRFSLTSIITFILVMVFAIGFLRGKIDNQVFTQVVGMVISFWFGASTSRAMPASTPVATTKQVETAPTGEKRETIITAPLGIPPVVPPVAPTVVVSPATPKPPGGPTP